MLSLSSTLSAVFTEIKIKILRIQKNLYDNENKESLSYSKIKQVEFKMKKEQTSKRRFLANNRLI